MVVGGSANGDSLGWIGEYTVVASAKRGVRGTFSDDADDELEKVRSLVKGSGRFFSSVAGEDCQQAYSPLL